jgi:ribose 5-phosphate isomerase B
MRSILIASDHAGYELKEEIKKHRSSLDVSFIDLGTNSSASVDYPDFARTLCKKLIELGADQHLGVLVCGSGVGVSIAANRYPEIRAVLAESAEVAKLAREHNHANVLCLGARVGTDKVTEQSLQKALGILKTFLTTPEDPGERHLRRIQKLGEDC